MAVGEGGQRGHLGDQAHHRHVALGGVVDLLGAGVERGERTHGREQHRHGVGVVAEALHHRLEVLVHVGVVRDRVLPEVVLVLLGQAAVHQEVGHLQEVGVLAQLLDRVAAVLEDAGLAVDVGDVAATAGRVGEGRVVGHQAEVVLGHLDGAEVHRLHRAVGDVHLVGLAGPVVGHGQRVLGRGYVPVGLLLVALLGHCVSFVAGWLPVYPIVTDGDPQRPNRRPSAPPPPFTGG